MDTTSKTWSYSVIGEDVTDTIEAATHGEAVEIVEALIRKGDWLGDSEVEYVLNSCDADGVKDWRVAEMHVCVLEG